MFFFKRVIFILNRDYANSLANMGSGDIATCISKNIKRHQHQIIPNFFVFCLSVCFVQYIAIMADKQNRRCVPLLFWWEMTHTNFVLFHWEWSTLSQFWMGSLRALFLVFEELLEVVTHAVAKLNLVRPNKKEVVLFQPRWLLSLAECFLSILSGYLKLCSLVWALWEEVRGDAEGWRDACELSRPYKYQYLEFGHKLNPRIPGPSGLVWSCLHSAIVYANDTQPCWEGILHLCGSFGIPIASSHDGT